MSTQNAASWGYYLAEENEWDIEALTQGKFPLRLLPSKILKPGESAGKLSSSWFGIPAGTTIGKINYKLISEDKNFSKIVRIYFQELLWETYKARFMLC